MRGDWCLRAAELFTLKAVPVTTPHSLSYRVMVSALATAFDDRHDWYAVPALMHAYDDPDFQSFPSAVAARDNYARVADAQVTSARRPLHFFQPFWVLLRNLEPIAIFDSAGVIHTEWGLDRADASHDSEGRFVLI